jgi:hypothetical protein
MKTKIVEIIDVPEFIKRYIEQDKSGTISELTHIFCTEILVSDIEYCVKEKTTHLYIDTLHNTKIAEFADLYLEKSELDHYLNCKYEDELDLYKSINNELFKIKISDVDKIMEFKIDSLENNTMILKEVL